jgi:hypothetical protein
MTQMDADREDVHGADVSHRIVIDFAAAFPHLICVNLRDLWAALRPY